MNVNLPYFYAFIARAHMRALLRFVMEGELRRLWKIGAEMDMPGEPKHCTRMSGTPSGAC